MKTQSPTLPAAHGTLQNLVRQVMQKISAMLEERRVKSRKKAAADMLEQMDPRLLDDIGIAPPKTPHAMHSRPPRFLPHRCSPCRARSGAEP